MLLHFQDEKDHKTGETQMTTHDRYTQFGVGKQKPDQKNFTRKGNTSLIYGYYAYIQNQIK